MSDRYLVSVTTPDYVRKALPYFDTVGIVRSAKTVCVLLDFDRGDEKHRRIEDFLREQCPWVDFRHLPLPWSHSNFMVQHGPFLDAIPEAKDDALICLTDLDVTVQRDFTPEEWAFFEGLGATQLSATWNGGPKDSLLLEADRIGLSDDWTGCYCIDLATIPVMNCGVMVGRVSAFRELQARYEAECREFYAATAHRSRCQWLINDLVDDMGGWKLLPPAIHTHFHFRGDDGTYLLPPGTEVRRKVVSEGAVPTVFVHNFPRGE